MKLFFEKYKWLIAVALILALVFGAFYVGRKFERSDWLESEVDRSNQRAVWVAGIINASAVEAQQNRNRLIELGTKLDGINKRPVSVTIKGKDGTNVQCPELKDARFVMDANFVKSWNEQSALTRGTK